MERTRWKMGLGSQLPFPNSHFRIPSSQLQVPTSQWVPYFEVVAKPTRKARRRKPRRFPWLLFILLLGSAYVLWVLPYQLGPRRISVDFEPGPTTTNQ